MESAKGSNQYKFEGYDVMVTVFSEKKLAITVVDPFEKAEFTEKLLTLTNIGTTTLMKALERKMLEVKMGIKVNKTPENTILQIDVLVASQFLKPVEEVIYIKKTRDISESEVLRNAVGLLSSKIKGLKENDKSGPNVVQCATQIDQKLYNVGVTFEPLATMKLKKGKYVLTLSFLGKATGTIMYIYFGQTQTVLPNYFYTPINSQFIPLEFRKVHIVNSDQETITFNTYYGQSYPVTTRNVVLTAQEIKA